MGFLDKLESIVKEVNNTINSPQTNNASNQNSDTTDNYFSPELEKLISIWKIPELVREPTMIS